MTRRSASLLEEDTVPRHKKRLRFRSESDGTSWQVKKDQQRSNRKRLVFALDSEFNIVTDGLTIYCLVFIDAHVLNFSGDSAC